MCVLLCVVCVVWCVWCVVRGAWRVRHDVASKELGAVAHMPVRAAVMSLISASLGWAGSSVPAWQSRQTSKVSSLHCHCCPKRSLASCYPQRITFIQPSSRCLLQREVRPFAPSSVYIKCHRDDVYSLRVWRRLVVTHLVRFSCSHRFVLVRLAFMFALCSLVRSRCPWDCWDIRA